MEWLIYGGIAIVVGWIILQPQRWGKRDEGSFDGGNTTVGVHPDHRHDNDDGSDSDGDGGGGDGGGGGD
jgi:hypothetical protein